MARLSPTSNSNILGSHQRYGIFPLIASSSSSSSMARTKCSWKRIQCKFYQTEKLMQIVVQLLAFYLLTNSILFFFVSLSTPYSVAFLFISVHIKFFNVVHQSLPIDCDCSMFVRRVFSSFASFCYCFCCLLLLLVSSEHITVLCRQRALSSTSHCIANQLNINNPITIAYFSIFFSRLVRLKEYATDPGITFVCRCRLCVCVSVYRYHYFEFYGFDFECSCLCG